MEILLSLYQQKQLIYIFACGKCTEELIYYEML